MPKPKPDNIVRHEIVLGRVEREMLDTAFTAMSFNRVMSPLVAGVSDVTFMAFVILAYNYIYNQNLPIPEEAGGLVHALKEDYDIYRTTPEYQENYERRSTSFAGGLRNLFENIIGGFGKDESDLNL